jgi:hypothetical protein
VNLSSKPESRKRWDEPGWPDIYTLTGAWLDGVNVTAIIDPAIVQELEERARWP